MTLLDANVLLHSYNATAPEQGPVSKWLERLLETEETIALTWVTIWAFLRISTNLRIWPKPLSAERAFAIVEDWLSQPGVIVLEPGSRHVSILKDIVAAQKASGSLVTDAVLAAIAIEHGATLASADQDFRRFPDLRWVNPLAPDEHRKPSRPKSLR